MRSVLHSQSPELDESKSIAAPGRNRLRRRKMPKFSVGVFAVAGLTLWLVGAVAWWQYQWWNAPASETAETENLPAHRIANEGRMELR